MQQYFLFELKDGKSILVGTYNTMEMIKQVINVRKSAYKRNKPQYEVADVYLDGWICEEDLTSK